MEGGGARHAHSCRGWPRFWVYDLDDLEDSALDGVSSRADYDSADEWKYNQDLRARARRLQPPEPLDPDAPRRKQSSLIGLVGAGGGTTHQASFTLTGARCGECSIPRESLPHLPVTLAPRPCTFEHREVHVINSRV